MKTMTILILILLAVPLSGCAGRVSTASELTAPASTAALPEHIPVEPVTGSTKIADVINDPLLGDYGAAAFGGDELPQPAAVMMQYTGHSEYSANDPATYACVGKSDGIANWRTMELRLKKMSELGIDTEFHVYDGLSHGFGLGTGTIAEGWLNDAVSFWQRQCGKA